MGKYEAVADFITLENKEFVEIQKIDETKPRVFVFHGALAVARRDADIVLKSARAFFADMGIKGYDFYSTHYSRKTLVGFLRYQKATEKERDMIKGEFKQAVMSLFEDILWPLIQKNMERISFEEVANNFKKVVFRGHCMGSLLVTNLGNLLVEKMRELRYSADEIRDLTYNIKVIFTSSIVLPHEIEANFDIYSFINLGDNELFKYAGEDWRANLMYMIGAKKYPDEPTVGTLQANNIDFVLLSSHLDNVTKQELEAEVRQANEANDRDRAKKLEKVLLGHAWSLIVHPYRKFEGVGKAYKMFKSMVSKAFE